jgi:DNA (cytosine-5)-methyltransferase 1
MHQQNWLEVPGHDLLLAAPACTGHTPARGKDQPHHDAQRATAWAVVSAAECHRPFAFVVENVPAFERWALFPAWCAAMQALGYSLSPMIVDAADHGVPQHRVRLFVVGTRSRNPILLNLPRRQHVPASRVIDLAKGRWSAIERPGRAANTLARIATARARFGDQFVMPYYGSGSGLTGRSLARPIGTVTTVDRWGVVNGDRMRMLTTQESRAAMGFPADYRLPAKHRDALHMLGNAVCPPVACDVIEALRKAA